MCGFAGFFTNQHQVMPLQSVITGMTDAISHRGPDDSGIWVDESMGLTLGHRRLSILDLSNAGHQPMRSADDRFIIIFNGQIYNHLELRQKLARQKTAPVWRSHCDTETLLACVSSWGIEHTLQAITGMFALVLWDKSSRTLTFARDRVGEKPLYYGWQNHTFLFGSELKALKAHPAWQGEIDRNSLALYLRHKCVPAPYSIYKSIYKLMPGHYMSIPLAGFTIGQEVESQAYWSINNVVQQGQARPFSGSMEEATDALEIQLSAAVKEQMQADVPVGAFLSGGIDSSLIVALMQTHSQRPVETFTIGFDDIDYNEAEHACAVAKHLGTKHNELYVSPKDALSIIPSLPHIYCEPQSANSQIPAILISKLASQQVRVALTGDGGDELFGGYNRYLMAYQTWLKTQRLPLPIRQILAAALRFLSPHTWDKLFDYAQHLVPRRLHIATPGNNAHKLAGVLDLNSGESFYKKLVSHWSDPEAIVKGSKEPVTLLTDEMCWPKTDCLEHWMMAMDLKSFLPDEVLTKIDRAAMANSLETRAPMLNHHVIEFAWHLPVHYKIHNGEGKWPLRQILYRHVPKALIERPKMGFGIPLGAWLRGPLRAWAEELIDERRLHIEGYFHPEPIRRMWVQHLSGESNVQYALWDILMFQSWLEQERTCA